PPGDDARTAATQAALSWANSVNDWPPGQGHALAAYHVGDTTQGEFSDVFAFSVLTFCGKAVADASWGVELVNLSVANTGSQADVVVAHFESGWQVWGAYHP